MNEEQMANNVLTMWYQLGEAWFMLMGAPGHTMSKAQAFTDAAIVYQEAVREYLAFMELKNNAKIQ